MNGTDYRRDAGAYYLPLTQTQLVLVLLTRIPGRLEILSADALSCCVPGTELSSYASQAYRRSVLSAGDLRHAGLFRSTWDRRFHGSLTGGIRLVSQVRFWLVWQSENWTNVAYTYGNSDFNTKIFNCKCNLALRPTVTAADHRRVNEVTWWLESLTTPWSLSQLTHTNEYWILYWYDSYNSG